MSEVGAALWDVLHARISTPRRTGSSTSCTRLWLPGDSLVSHARLLTRMWSPSDRCPGGSAARGCFPRLLSCCRGGCDCPNFFGVRFPKRDGARGLPDRGSFGAWMEVEERKESVPSERLGSIPLSTGAPSSLHPLPRPASNPHGHTVCFLRLPVTGPLFSLRAPPTPLASAASRRRARCPLSTMPSDPSLLAPALPSPICDRCSCTLARVERLTHFRLLALTAHPSSAPGPYSRRCGGLRTAQPPLFARACGCP